MSGRNLRRMFDMADSIDRQEGRLAYLRYHQVIARFAVHYDAPFDQTLAAFVALSPNSDYFGNLRSLASVLDARRKGRPVFEATVSTYNHCRARAWSYLTGEVDFLETVKGPKVRAFYHNIHDPGCPRHVTIDGHMVCAYRNISAPMKEVQIGKRDYDKISNATKRLAKTLGLLPNQVQATIWLARKRVMGIKYNPQIDLFRDPGDVWRTDITPDEARPY